jgi:nucleolin
LSINIRIKIKFILKMSKAKNTKNIDKMLSDSSEEEVQTKKVVSKAPAKVPVKKPAPTKDSDDESSDEEIEILKGKREREAEAKTKQQASAIAKTQVKVTKKAVEPSESDESEDVKPKKVVAKAPAAKKKVESDSDEESSEVVAVKAVPAKTPVVAKAPVKKAAVSDDDSDDSDVKPAAKKAPVKAQPVVAQKKVEESDEDEDSEEEEVKPIAKKPVAQTQAQEQPSSGCTELFVKNLGWKTDENILGNFFGTYGEVQNVKVLYDRETGKSRGLAFVNFSTREEAQAAINDADNLNVEGRLLQVSFSDQKPQRDNNSNAGGRGGFQGGNRGGDRFGGQGGNRGNFGGEKHTIFVGNLGFKTTENNLRNFFKDCGSVVDVRIAKNEEGRSKGFAHVDFEAPDAVEKAKSKAGQELDGRELRVDASTPRQGGGSGGRGGRGGFGGRGGGRGGYGGGRGGGFNSMNKKSGSMGSANPNAVMTFDDDE